MKKKFSHISNSLPKIVDLSEINITIREAIAEGEILFSKSSFNTLSNLKTIKGEINSVAVIAGILGSKKTSGLIPLCHNIPIEDIKTSPII